MSLEEELAAFAEGPPPPRAPEPKAAPPPPLKPKESKELPYTIRTIIAQCGGMGLRGAFTYVGAHQFTFKCPQREGECRSSYRSKVTDEGLVDYDVGLTFRVNGRPTQGWRTMIVYEPDDTYSVWLWRRTKPTELKAGKGGVVIDNCGDVYFDSLKEVVERMYDRAIKEHNDGFIPLS